MHHRNFSIPYIILQTLKAFGEAFTMILTMSSKFVLLSLCLILSYGFHTNADNNMTDVMKEIRSLRTLLFSNNQKVFSLEQEISTLKQESLQCKVAIQGVKRNQKQVSDLCTNGCTSGKEGIKSNYFNII